jgi:hypothetical protein
MFIILLTNLSSFFLILFKFDNAPKGIDRFVEVEFKEQDREWAKLHFMSRSQ